MFVGEGTLADGVRFMLSDKVAREKERLKKTK